MGYDGIWTCGSCNHITNLVGVNPKNGLLHHLAISHLLIGMEGMAIKYNSYPAQNLILNRWSIGYLLWETGGDPWYFVVERKNIHNYQPFWCGKNGICTKAWTHHHSCWASQRVSSCKTRHNLSSKAVISGRLNLNNLQDQSKHEYYIR